MCGFASILDLEHAFDPSRVLTMVEQIPYRGPDGSGHKYFEEGVALAHKRLSIIDTSIAGNQPMPSADERYWVVFNGEIYNYLELKQDLLAEGYIFRTQTDTEVLLNAYICWGEKCLERFIGMFAFVIWDRSSKTLFAARDRMGIKPLYYCHANSRFYVASEAKCIISVLPQKPGPDETLIDAYMDFGYVPGENTMHKGIKRLLPGHKLSIGPNGFETTHYWSSEFVIDDDLSLEEHCLQIHQLFKDAVQLRLRSDVPLGVFLSGGLDSSAVVSYLAPEVREGLNTFSVAYEYGPQYDETSFAREVARKFGTAHHEIRIDTDEFTGFVPEYVRLMDEPVTEAAAISLFYVSRLAREHVVVALSGEGSDELFAGYDFYFYNLLIEKLRKIMGQSSALLSSKVGQALVPHRKLSKYFRLAAQSLPNRYKGISSYEALTKNMLYNVEFKALAERGNDDFKSFLYSLWEKSKEWDPLSRMLYFDQRTWLVDDLLIKADRMSMANSLELRVPFLDHRLVEYAARIPSHFKIKKRQTKHILKQVLNQKVPQRIVHRKKMGFPTPLEHMLRGKLLAYAKELLLARDTAIKRYFKQDAMKKLLNEHESQKAQHHKEIWQLIVLEQWHRSFGYDS